MVDPPNLLPRATVLVVFQQRAVASWVADRLGIGDCLREAGYVVAVAKGYDDALSALCIVEPDAVVVSATKLDEDTEQFLGRLESDPHAIGILTVLVSPTKSQAALAHMAARRNPRFGYLSWPLKCRDLRLIMQDLLQTGTQTKNPIPSRHVDLDLLPQACDVRPHGGCVPVSWVEAEDVGLHLVEGHRPPSLADKIVRQAVFIRRDDRGSTPSSQNT